jgi:Rod binding domain-containing protein
MQVGLDNANRSKIQNDGIISPRLLRAAQEFEAQMMKELLKPMTGQNALTGEETETGGDAGAGGALGEFASEALGQAISRHGGFGIADRIVHDLSRSGHLSANGKFAKIGYEKNAVRANE